MGEITTGQFLVAYVLATAAGIAVFFHADRNGSKRASAWGISVFLFLAIALPVYLIHVRRLRGAARR